MAIFLSLCTTCPLIWSRVRGEKILYLPPYGFAKGFSEFNSWGRPSPGVRVSSISFLPWPSDTVHEGCFLACHFEVDLARQSFITWHLEVLTFSTCIWFWCEDTPWLCKSPTWGFSAGWEAHTGWVGMGWCRAQGSPLLIIRGSKDSPESEAGQGATSSSHKTNKSGSLIGSLALDDLKKHINIYF